MEEIKKIADEHDALIVEDAAESLGAKYKLNGQWGRPFLPIGQQRA